MPIPLVFLITDLDLGGCPLLLRTLAVGLRRRAFFAPTVISLKPLGPVATMLRAEGIAVHTLNLTSPLQFPRALFRLVSLLREIRPAVVHSLLIHANLMAALARFFYAKAVYLPSLHTLQERPRWHWWLQGWLLFFAKSRIMLAPSEEILQKVGVRGRISRGYCVHNGIDLERFRRAVSISPPLSSILLPSPSNPLPLPPNAKIVGYMGRFDPIKRLPLLIEAAAHIIRHNSVLGPHLQVVLVGYGPQEAALRALARDLGMAERVHFPGPTQEPEKWYKSFDCFCLPSEAEGQPVALIEALAAGLRVVATDLPAIRQIAQGDARLVSPLTAETLALALTEVMTAPPPSSEALATRFARLSATYSQEAMVSKYEKIFKDFCPA